MGIASKPTVTYTVPAQTNVTELKRMFWSIEFNGHPVHLMNDAYGHLVDMSSNTGGVFIFNSCAYSISRIITGQLDAYVDVGNRILRDHPETRIDFERAGRGNVCICSPMMLLLPYRSLRRQASSLPTHTATVSTICR